MKPLITLSAALFAFQFAVAQYCGNSGPTICNSSGTLTTPGLTPSEDVPCINRNQLVNITIDFKNFDTFTFGGQQVTVSTLRFDTILGLPSGLCWSTNKANNTFGNQEDGCIRITGVTADALGQYKLHIVVTADIGVPIQTNGDAAGLKYFLRLTDQSFSVCPPIDTNQTVSYAPFSGNFQNVSQVTGRIFFDNNQNNVFDGNDIGAANQMVSISNNYVALTNNQGIYNAFLPVGNYTIQPAAGSFVSAFQVTPPQKSLNVPSIGNLYSGNDFAVVAPATVCLGKLSIIGATPPPRPGFTNVVKVRFQNLLSTTTTTQTVRLFYTEHQSFVNAVPAPSFIDTAAHRLEWVVSNLNVGAAWDASVTLQTPPPPAVPNGTILDYAASIINASCSSLDTIQVRQQLTVVGSYDPNDKAVSPIGYSDNHSVHPDNTLTYTVRFQNTGTYLAEKVVIVDTISQYLNLSTLRVTTASHNYETQIEPNRAVKFIFDQINLPDSTSDEPGSHGFIQYTIHPNASVANGNIVTNRADIYFDFNPPILTNTVYTTMDRTVSIGAELSGDKVMFAVYPNPSIDGLLNIEADKKLLGEKLQVTDLSGKLLFETILQQEHVSIKLPAVAKGVYLLKAGNGVRKLLIQ